VGYIFDLIIVLVVILIITRTVHNGFIKTAAGGISWVAAIVVAFALNVPISGFIYKIIIRPAMNSIINNATKGSVAWNLARVISSQTSHRIFSVIVFIVLIALTLFVVRKLIKTDSKLFKKPVVDITNKILGALLGFILAVFIVSASIAMLRVTSPILGLPATVISQESYKKSLIYRPMHKNNPIAELIESNL